MFGDQLFKCRQYNQDPLYIPFFIIKYKWKGMELTYYITGPFLTKKKFKKIVNTDK